MLGGALAWWLSHSLLQTDEAFTSNEVTTITMAGWALGFMIGIGAFTGPWRWMLGPRPDA